VTLGVIAVTGSVVLIVSDGFVGTIQWSHHAGLSAAPLFLVAGAITALTIGHPPRGHQLLMRSVTVVAFVAWGLSQLLSDSVASGVLDDVGILLFVVDGAWLVFSDATRRLQMRTTAGRAGVAEQPTASAVADRECCTRPNPCSCVAQSVASSLWDGALAKPT
jgi:hypothetical protein